MGSAPETLKPESTSARTDAKPEGTSARTDAKAEPARSAAADSRLPLPPRPSEDGHRRAGGCARGHGGRPGRWVVQLVALRDRNAAAAIVQRLSGRGFPAFVVNPSASTPNQVYKVQVGRYDDRSEADRVAKRLEKEEKFNPWISR